MVTLYTQQDSNVRKTWALMFLFFALIAGAGYFASWYMNSPALLWGAALFAGVTNISAFWFSDKIALASTGAKQVTREEQPDLWNLLENLSITAGMPMPKLYIINDPAPNAFATGRNKEHAAVAVTTGLVQMLDRSELEGVLAHELSHIGNRDILIMTVAVVLVGFLAMLSDIALRMSFFGGSRDSKNGGVLAIVGFVLILLAPIAGKLMQFAVSRKREFLADASGALLTRYPEGLASALQKISGYKAPMKRASHATAHLFIASPFGRVGSNKGIADKFSKYFSTHPRVAERVAALRGQHT